MNSSSIAGCVIMHKEAAIHPHDSAHGTKATTSIVKEPIGASEVEGEAEGGYCSKLRRTVLYLYCFVLCPGHLVSREGAVHNNLRITLHQRLVAQANLLY